MRKRIYTLVFLFLFFSVTAFTQNQHSLYADNYLYVKFKDNSKIVGPENVINIDGPIPENIFTLGHLLKSYNIPADTLTKWRQRAARNLNRYIPDPNMSYHFMVNHAADLDRAKQLLETWDLVDYVLYAPIPVNATPGDFFPQQNYIYNHASGINAEAVWTTYNNHGGGIKICDVEYFFNAFHEDLNPVTVVGNPPTDPFGSTIGNHGTAVLGQLGSISNGWGTTGLVTDSDLYFAGAYTFGVYDVSAGIMNAISALSAGDMILIEQQIAGPNYDPSGSSGQYGLVPVEWYVPNYDAIVLAIGQNITVIEAAGNGQQNLDDAIYSTDNDGHYPFLPGNGSGAIIVGAGAVSSVMGGSDVARSRLWYSNYGSAVDIQGNGEAIVTTGYGELYSFEGDNLLYTNDFGGTSGASPIVTGAATLLQSVYKNTTGNVLSCEQIRHYLEVTGQPQQAGTYAVTQKIGPLPNVPQAISLALSEVGIKDVQEKIWIQVYPNPGTGLFYLSFEKTGGSFEVMNMMGEIIQKHAISDIQMQLDLSQQPNGIYLVKSGGTTCKIVVER